MILGGGACLVVSSPSRSPTEEERSEGKGSWGLAMNFTSFSIFMYHRPSSSYSVTNKVLKYLYNASISYILHIFKFVGTCVYKGMSFYNICARLRNLGENTEVA